MDVETILWTIFWTMMYTLGSVFISFRLTEILDDGLDSGLDDFVKHFLVWPVEILFLTIFFVQIKFGINTKKKRNHK